MKYIVTINGKKYEVEVEKGQANIIGITDSAASAAIAAMSAGTPAKTAKTEETPAHAVSQMNVSGEPLKAPMPGTILSIKISKGSSVKKGDVLFILEAMKMENEITAPKDGIIAQIAATKGLSVSTGDLLAVIQ